MLLLPILHEHPFRSLLTYVLEWSIWGAPNEKILESVEAGEIPIWGTAILRVALVSARARSKEETAKKNNCVLQNTIPFAKVPLFKPI